MLRVAGVLVDTIQHQDGIRIQHGWGPEESYKEFHRLLIDVIHPEKTSIDDDMIEHVARTFVCNNLSAEPPNKWAPRIEDGKRMVRTMLSNIELPRNLPPDEVKFVSNYGAVIGMQKFKTADGQFGVALPEAQSGDQICVVLGCDAPMILRETRSGTYLVVGSCYMQIVYEGEALLGPLSGHVRRVLAQENSTFLYRWEDSRSGVLFREDPRLESLNFDLNNYRKREDEYKLAVNPEILRREGVDITYFDLV